MFRQIRYRRSEIRDTNRCALGIAPLIPLLLATSLSAATLYVDNRQGSDRFDGRSDQVVDVRSGPVRSIRRALKLAGTGDTISIANTGRVYYESVSLVGRRHSGHPRTPFRLIGNGAVVSGARRVPRGRWVPVGEDVWKLKLWRKGHYQILLDGRPLPETVPPPDARVRPPIPAGTWSAWRGVIYYQTAPHADPNDMEFAFGYSDVGLTLYAVDNVEVQGLTFRHFRLDGVNAHDRCERITLTEVKSVENGRAGLAVGGSSGLVARGCELLDNRRHSLLITETAAARLVQSKLSQPPTISE